MRTLLKYFYNDRTPPTLGKFLNPTTEVHALNTSPPAEETIKFTEQIRIRLGFMAQQSGALFPSISVI